MLKKICIGLIGLFLVSNIYAANIGLSPATLKFKNVLRNGYAENFATITVDSEKPVEVSIEKAGEIKEWINISTKKANVSKTNPLQLKISVTPPKDIPNGNYSGYLKVMVDENADAIPNKAVGVIKAAMELNIVVEVTDIEYISCRASNFKVFSAEKGDDAILQIEILNDGNVALSPHIKGEIWNQEQTEIVKEIDYSKTSISPTIKKKINIKIPTNDLEIGQYWIQAYALDCYNSYLLTFDVLEPGTLKAEGILEKIVALPWINQGETTQIQALFRNIGEKNVDAQFIGKITQNGKIIQVLRSKKLFVETGKQEVFPFYFTPKNPGKYIVSGRVFYANKRTYEKSAIINVRPVGINIKKIAIDIAYILLIALIIFLLIKIHQERNKIKKLK